MRQLAHIIGSTFGIGFIPVAPGTAASIITVAIVWFLPTFLPSLWLIVLPAVFFIGVWAATMCEQEWGPDPGRVVWDEVFGMIIAVLAVPKHWLFYATAFTLFRIFDIIKPFPIYQSQKLPGGWGIMVDDVIAGLYANLLCQVLFRMMFKSFAGF